ncbi:unnamed protein product [Cuscuta campestris]|uniref:Uncharacterized protein n=1 Tax=Cuscuta campestris TaxID=132261 RepID=A0A484L9N2_9ASTE|nr:unnamed protein product [Cuscuta campestris]
MLVEELTLGNQKEKEEDNWDFGTHSEDGKIDEVIDCTDLKSKPNSLFITKSLLTMQRPCYILFVKLLASLSTKLLSQRCVLSQKLLKIKRQTNSGKITLCL